MDVITLALSKKYTDNSISGISGSLAGKNCVVNSITHDDTNKKNVVEFCWTADDGSSKTAQMDVPDGLTITSLSVDSNNHLIATLSDGSTIDSGKMPSTEVAISAESGNALTEKTDGLYVSTTGVEISKATDNAIETKADGLYVKKTSDVEISKTTGNTIETKADGLFVPATDISGKVDKVNGKGLSTNDYTDTEKAEVAKVKDKLDSNKVVTSFSATTLDTNVPSEKLVKDSLDDKADKSSVNAIYDGGFASRNLYADEDVSATSIVEKNLTNELEAGTYTISLVATSSDTSASECRIDLRKAGNIVLANGTIGRDSRSSCTLTITEPANKLCLYASTDYVSSTGKTISASDIQIEKGSVATSYTKYAKSNVELAEEIVNVSESVDELADDISIATSSGTTLALDTANGGIKVNKVVGKSYKSKNLLNPTLATTTTNGVTCTNNGDGTFTVNGTATEQTIFNLCDMKLTADKKYRLVGCPDGGGNGKYFLLLRGRDYGKDYGEGVTFDGEDYSNNIGFIIANGYTVTNLLVKPMLVDLTANPNLENITYDDYEPYGLFNSADMGCVDLGSLTWIYNANYGKNGGFYCQTDFGQKKVSANDIVPNIFCEKYPTFSDANAKTTTEKCVFYAERNGSYWCVAIIDTDYTDATSFKNAMQGVLLAYEYSSTPSQFAEVVEEHGANISDYESGTFSSSGVDATSSTRLRTKGYVEVNSSKSYSCEIVSKVSGKTPMVSLSYFSEQGSERLSVTDWLNVPCKFIPPNTTQYIKALFKWSDGSSITVDNVDIMLTETNTTIIPLTEPLYEQNVISNDGIVKKYACVDLGSLSWTLTNNDTYEYWFTDVRSNNIKQISAYTDVFNGISEKYRITSWSLGVTKTRFATNNSIALFPNSSSRIAVQNGSDTEKPSGLLVYELATETTTPLTTEQTKAINSLKAYNGKTYIDTADKYAKATLDVEYNKSDIGSLAIENVNLCEINKALVENVSNSTITKKVYENNNITIHKIGKLAQITFNGATGTNITQIAFSDLGIIPLVMFESFGLRCLKRNTFITINGSGVVVNLAYYVSAESSSTDLKSNSTDLIYGTISYICK